MKSLTKQTEDRAASVALEGDSMNQLIIDPIPKHMTRTFGIGNKMKRNAYNHTKVGKKYLLPIHWHGETVGSGRHRVVKYEMLTCEGKYDYFAVFSTPRNLKICFDWYDLAIEYQKGAVL